MTNCNNFRANSLSDLIAKLRQMFESNSVDIDQVKALMASYQSNPAEWIQYTHCDPHRYTRNGVDVGNGKYNLMIVCWPQNITTQVHDHSDSHCIMKILTGSLCEVRYRWPKAEDKENIEQCGLEKISETPMDNDNSVVYINDQLGLHKIVNPDPEQFAVSLHLYSPPFSQCHTFDETTGFNQKVSLKFDTEHTPVLPHYKVSRRKISTGLTDKNFLVFEQQPNTADHQR